MYQYCRVHHRPVPLGQGEHRVQHAALLPLRGGEAIRVIQRAAVPAPRSAEQIPRAVDRHLLALLLITRPMA